MHIEDAQREMRSAFQGGFMGQFVAGAIWLTSAALATWSTPGHAILFLVVAGFFIFPLTRVGLRLVGRSGVVGHENGLHSLGAQVAMVLPLTLPLVGAATLYRMEWFYPAFMVALGAHYLPFVFLYGMRMFGALCIVLFVAGILLGTGPQTPFATGGWITGTTLLAFAFLGRFLVLGEEASAVRGAPAGTSAPRWRSSRGAPR